MMNLRHILASACVATLLATPSAHALTYATSVTTELNQFANSNPNSTDRTDAGNALGAPDGVSTNPVRGFFSLGLGKWADFKFGSPFTGDGVVYEITSGTVDTYPEFVDILVYNSPLENAVLQFVTTVRNNAATFGASFTFSGTWDTLRLLDVTERECGNLSLNCGNPSSPNGSLGSNGDGFDVDAVGVSVVPLPAAAWLLLGVSGALIAAKRRHSRKAA
jgi:hypothetical protein